MTLLLLLFVAIVVINLGHLLLHNFIKRCHKKTINIIESAILRIKRRLQQPEQEEEEIPIHEYNPFHDAYAEGDEQQHARKQEVIKTLKRRRRDEGTWRSRIHTYIDYLNDGHGAPIEQFFWKAYERYIPQWARYIDKETNFTHPLPRWLEWSIRAYQSRFMCRIIQILIFYVLLVMTANLWLPATNIDNTAPPLLSSILNRSVVDCHLGHTTDTYCFLPDVIYSLRDMTLRGFTSLRIDNYSHHERDFLLDEAYQIYASFNLLSLPSERNPFWTEKEEEGAPIVSRPFIKVRETLLPLIESLHSEEGQYVCICAPFLNLLENMTFYRENGEWRLLMEPVIVRNSTFSDLVLSSVRYQETSRFFTKDLAFKQLVPHLHDERMHHDSFVVEYSDLLSDAPLQVMQHMIEMNERLENHYRDTSKKEEDVSRVHLYTRLTGKPVRRRVHLSGKDAICFVYCNALNEALLTR